MPRSGPPLDGDADAPSPPNDELEARLEAIRSKLIEGLPARADALREAAHRICPEDGRPTEELRRLAHRLAGIAGSHGFHGLTEESRAAEQLIGARAPLERVREAALALARSCDAAFRDPAKASSRPPGPGSGRDHARGRSILAVEDDGSTAELLALTLGELGRYRPTVVRTAEAGLELLERRAFDLVLVDAMLPGMNGLEFTRAVRESASPTRGIPIVVLSAASPDELGWDLEARGALAPDGWLRKPIRARSLLADLDGFLSARRPPA